MAVWAFIEGFGLMTGMRVYTPSEDRLLVFIFVALVEDSGWVCLGYMIAEQLFKRFPSKKKITAKKATT
jgi:membrane protein DedA with SNARE-associated domain